MVLVDGDQDGVAQSEQDGARDRDAGERMVLLPDGDRANPAMNAHTGEGAEDHEDDRHGPSVTGEHLWKNQQ